MSDLFHRIETDEAWRRSAFPSCASGIFMAHAAVTALPQAAVDAMNTFNDASATGELDYSRVFLKEMDEVRESAAHLIECDADEVALLGPTSLGLSLVANGIDWKSGDEVVTYLDDYPANVYPWKHLEALGVKVVFLQPGNPGEITLELVKAAVTPATRLLALASNHFLSGYRLDIESVGRLAEERGILFCLDAIQTVGAFRTAAKHVDFLAADSHKWMLGPLTAGIFYVKRSRMDQLRPSLVGAWNVKCPDFIARETVEFERGGRRYEPGVLNAQGLLGMKASMDILTAIGIERIEERLLDLKDHLRQGLSEMGMSVIGPRSGLSASGITTCTDREHPEVVRQVYEALLSEGVVLSLRHDRGGVPYLRFSPHFYNTHAEIDMVLRIFRASRGLTKGNPAS